VFLAVTAEEKGLLGSEYYAQHPLYPVAKTAADLNVDAWLPDGRQKDFTVRGTAKLDLVDDVIAAGKAQGRYFVPDPHPETGGFYRSDHFPFAKAGVPAISFSPGLDLLNGGTARGEALAKEFNAKHYHQPSDEWHADWDWSGVAENAALLHQVGLKLANSREWPNWGADSEFRAARDATAAERTGAAPAPTTEPPKKGERG
jgi:Zn-dependent M28 family amino/carboxypeptidase